MIDQNPRWTTASATGGRTVNADAVASFADPITRCATFALADGVGDNEMAARAARIAASAAAKAPRHGVPAAAILAAQRALPELGDAALVVAQATPTGGYRIAWVGDVRAYARHGDHLHQLTSDHTLAAYFRARHQPVTPRMEHIIVTSVRTVTPDGIGTTEIGPCDALLLTSDGVHKSVTATTLAGVLANDPVPGAAALVHTATLLGTTDNATALLVEHATRSDDSTTLALTA